MKQHENFVQFEFESRENATALFLHKVQQSYKVHKGARPHYIVASTEHPSILGELHGLWKTNAIDLSVLREVSADAVENALRANTALVIVSMVDLWSGTEHPVYAITALSQERGIPVLCDCQAALDGTQLPIDLTRLNCLLVATNESDKARVLLHCKVFQGYYLHKTASFQHPKSVATSVVKLLSKRQLGPIKKVKDCLVKQLTPHVNVIPCPLLDRVLIRVPDPKKITTPDKQLRWFVNGDLLVVLVTRQTTIKDCKSVANWVLSVARQ